MRLSCVSLHSSYDFTDELTYPCPQPFSPAKLSIFGGSCWWWIKHTGGGKEMVFFLDFFFGLFLKKLHTSSETNNNLNTMQFLYVQNLGHRDPVSFVIYLHCLPHTAVICSIRTWESSYTKTNYVQTPGKQLEKATGLGMNRQMGRKSHSR